MCIKIVSLNRKRLFKLVHYHKHLDAPPRSFVFSVLLAKHKLLLWSENILLKDLNMKTKFRRTKLWLSLFSPLENESPCKEDHCCQSIKTQTE